VRLLDPNLGFDDDGAPVAVVAPAVYDEPAAEDEVRVARLEAIAALITWLTSGRVGPLQIGRRALLIAHTLDGQRGSQRRLAKRLGVTESQVSQALKRLRAALRSLADGSGT
jgi:DNA-directed RNA polymerase specialized sigma24 family protein